MHFLQPNVQKKITTVVKKWGFLVPVGIVIGGGLLTTRALGIFF